MIGLQEKRVNRVKYHCMRENLSKYLIAEEQDYNVLQTWNNILKDIIFLKDKDVGEYIHFYNKK